MSVLSPECLPECLMVRRQEWAKRAKTRFLQILLLAECLPFWVLL